MGANMAEVLRFCIDNDVKFVRLAFCDLFGVPKNIAILSSQLERAFQNGVAFDASAVGGFGDVTDSDLLLFPDPDTLSLMPWRPAQGRVARFYCRIAYPDGRTFEGDGRALLAQAAAGAQREGYSIRLGTECEFYLFTTDAEGRPTRTPHDRAGYFDVAPADRGENVRRDICLTLEEMGIPPESSHHERGPGQNEIDFRPSELRAAVDDAMTLRAVVKAIASRSGLYASFLPSPLPQECGSGLNLRFGLYREGKNLFDGFDENPDPKAGAFLAGVMRRLGEMTVFLNPLPGSYRRLGLLKSALNVAWSPHSRSQLLRAPCPQGEAGRMEVRSPDPACHPYLVAALLVEAGMEGIRDGLLPPSPQESGRGPENRRLPGSLGQALEEARSSAFLKGVFPPAVQNAFFSEKARQWEEYRHAPNQYQWELDRFFEVI